LITRTAPTGAAFTYMTTNPPEEGIELIR